MRRSIDASVAATVFSSQTLPGHAYFTMESGERRAVIQEMIGKELQRDGLAQLEIIGPINFAHAAFPQQAHDAIALREHRARYKASIVDRVERRR